MTVIPIYTWPHDVLREVCVRVENVSGAALLAQDMLDTMYDAPGRGLAAPQVGVRLRLFVMDVTWRDGTPDPQVCINPEILWRDGPEVAGTEGCLSLPGVTAEITRAARIGLRWTDQHGRLREEALDGFAARCAQHEIDHLDGKLIFDHLDQTSRDGFLERYAVA